MKPLPRMRSFRGALAVVGFGATLAVILLANAALKQDEPSTQPATRPAAADGLVEAEGGVKYRITAEPDAELQAREGDVLMVHYTGKLEDGTVFDTSRQIRRGQREPFPLPLIVRLGDGAVIRGWEIGLTGMRVGEQRELVIPPALAYGDRGAGGVIPPGATLTFDVHLVGLDRAE